jgi:D-proline reductase (dithiol) PrdB
MLEIEAYPVENVEELWDAWNTRCNVSHYPTHVPARNEYAEFYKIDKPLSDMRVALITSGGVYLHTDEPFDMKSNFGDSSLRWIPGDVDVADLRFEHDHYDHNDADQDPNCMFPIERLRELAAEGVIGSVAAEHVGFMGWIPNPDQFVHETLPELVARFKEDHVDAVVISPG